MLGLQILNNELFGMQIVISGVVFVFLPIYLCVHCCAHFHQLATDRQLHACWYVLKYSSKLVENVDRQVGVPSTEGAADFLNSLTRKRHVVEI
jgi:hypothetical protein